jgi:hypothetical protein
MYAKFGQRSRRLSHEELENGSLFQSGFHYGNSTYFIGKSSAFDGISRVGFIIIIKKSAETKTFKSPEEISTKREFGRGNL